MAGGSRVIRLGGGGHRCVHHRPAVVAPRQRHEDGVVDAGVAVARTKRDHAGGIADEVDGSCDHVVADGGHRAVRGRRPRPGRVTSVTTSSNPAARNIDA